MLLSQTKAYVKRYDDEAKWVNFLIDDKLFFIYHKKILDIVLNGCFIGKMKKIFLTTLIYLIILSKNDLIATQSLIK